MKNRWKNSFPFVTDQSGAGNLLDQFGGLTVFRDYTTENDELFLEKLARDCQDQRPNFIALIAGKRPPAGGLNQKRMRRMIEAESGIPCLLIDANGEKYYDAGAEQGWLELFKTFTEPYLGIEINRLGILGLSFLDGNLREDELNRNREELFAHYLPARGRDDMQILAYGMDGNIEEVKMASTASKNLVTAPTALKAARYLAKRFGIPYELGYPLKTIPGYEEFLKRITEQIQRDGPCRILIAHQQILAQELRRVLYPLTRQQVVVANFFDMDKELRTPWDLPVMGEEQWNNLAMHGDYDIIIGDEWLKTTIPEYQGSFYILNLYAMSGNPVEFRMPDADSDANCD